MKQLNHYETIAKMKIQSTDLILCLCGISAENLGLIMRTADIFSVKEIYYLGSSELNYNKIKKNSRGSNVTITFLDGINKLFYDLKSQGYDIIALEITDSAIPLRTVKLKEKTCLVVGNEKTGVPQEILDMVDNACYIEMLGKNISSLNVSISTAIATNKYVELKNSNQLV